MRNLEEFISEKLKISKIERKYKPKTKEELIDLIIKEIETNGPECSLNQIDVSNINDMSFLFRGGDSRQYRNGHPILTAFDGDISNWNVSNVTNMQSMFDHCKYSGNNGDISDWDVSSVTNMSDMFNKSKFNGDISDWDVSSVELFYSMFRNSIFSGYVSGWKLNPKAKGHIDSMFERSPLENTLPYWYYKYV